jgi:hypothetical protein
MRFSIDRFIAFSSASVSGVFRGLESRLSVLAVDALPSPAAAAAGADAAAAAAAAATVSAAPAAAALVNSRGTALVDAGDGSPPLPAHCATDARVAGSFGSFHGNECWPGASFQPPLDAFTRGLYPVPGGEAVGEGAGARRARAYIITVNTSALRYRYTAVRAAASGMSPVPHFGSWPRSDAVRNPGWAALCAVRFAHKTALTRLIDDADAAEDDWAFVFEDDVDFVPPVTGAVVHAAWRRAVRDPDVARRGLLYLGYCAPTEIAGAPLRVVAHAGEAIGGAPPLPAPLELAFACGSCQHAYGVRKDFARRYWELLLAVSPAHDDGCNASHAAARGADPHATPVNADTSVIYACMSPLINGTAYLGRGFGQQGGHVGLFHQDRSHFGSILDGGRSSSHGLKTAPTIADARRRR